MILRQGRIYDVDLDWWEQGCESLRANFDKQGISPDKKSF